MHTYQADGREKVTVILAIASIFLAWALNVAFGTVNVILPWWVGPPSFMGGYAILSWMLEHHAWKWNVLRILGIVKIVNLHGEWEGFVKSSYDKYASKIPISVTIVQRWSKISIRIDASQSRSFSAFAMLKTRDIDRPQLLYMYENRPRPEATTTMHAHGGTAALEFYDGMLKGDYYTGRDRSTVGIIELRRIAAPGSPHSRD